MLEESTALQRCYDDALTRHPSSEATPWHMVVIFGEVCPGNKLKLDNSRKSMNFIFNFMELGANVLPITATWLMPVTIRSTRIKTIESGWSHVLAQTLRHICMGSENFASDVAVEVCGTPQVIHAECMG